VSTLMPTAMVFRVSKAFLFASRDFICSAQTLVQASGWNESRIFLPLNLDSVKSCSSWSSKVKIFALSPTFSFLFKCSTFVFACVLLWCFVVFVFCENVIRVVLCLLEQYSSSGLV